MAKIIIHTSDQPKAGVYVVTYASGKFKKLEHKRGTITERQFKELMSIVPPTMADFDAFRLQFPRVRYEVEMLQKSLFSTLLADYHEFYINLTGISPKIDGIAGKHLNQIIAHLKRQSADDAEVATTFKIILQKWEELPPFYRQQFEIRQINSNINIILNCIKNGKSDSKSKATNLSDDFRQSI